MAKAESAGEWRLGSQFRLYTDDKRCRKRSFRNTSFLEAIDVCSDQPFHDVDLARLRLVLQLGNTSSINASRAVGIENSVIGQLLSWLDHTPCCDSTVLSKLCAPSYSSAYSYQAPLADSCTSRLDYSSDFDGDVVLERHAELALCRISRRRADLDALVDDTATANSDPAMRRIELVAGMDDGLAADVDGVVSGQDGIVVNDYRRREIDRRFWELPCPGHHRVPLSRGRHGGGDCLSWR